MVEIQKAYTSFCAILQQAGIENSHQEVDWLIEKVTGKQRFALNSLSDDEWQQLNNMVTERKRHMPLQYLLGYWPFLNLDLQVGQGVLIPRSETEEVCLFAIEQAKKMQAKNIVDLCSGTGAIALAMQQALPFAQVTAVELYQEAYSYLNKNIDAFRQEYGYAPSPIQQDALLFYQQLQNESIDLLISNPPYISKKEYATLEKELFYEPRTALEAEQDGLIFYQAFAQNYYDKLKQGGFIIFEIGYNQAQSVRLILQTFNYKEVQVLQDSFGQDRIVCAFK